jgi:YVTN family beta-propeller protein
MDFRILGPLEVREDEGEVRLGRGKQRALLALLLLHRDEAISTDRIIDELWGEQPPATAAKIVQNYVLQLRRALEDGGSADADLITQGRGYLLRVERGGLDLDRFEALVEAGERALGSGEAAQAAETLREALALWRGPPLADFAYEPFAQAAIERLEDQRLAALERRIEADLALGRHADVVGELKELVSVHPLHEGFRAQLMLALYHTGRQAQALEVYRDARRSLVEELGIDPSPALQQLEQAILRQEVPPAASRPPPPARGTRDPAPAVVADAPAGEGRGSRGADLRTFLIADIRGYTRFSQDHGDGAASRLAHRFADIVREAIPTEVGELLELRGDEALCVFSSAREALQTAVELQRRFRARINGEPALPLGVGVGLDAGEAVPIDGGYRGRALNVAARLSALAQPGEILASETVMSLAGHQEGASYARRRPARLKGLAEPVRHVAVVPDVALPPVPAAPRPSARRQGLFLLAAGALVLTGTVTAAILTLTRDADESVESIGNAIAAIDGDGGAVSYTEAGNTPSTIAVGEGAVWVLNAGDRTVSKIDPETRRIVKTFGTGGTTTDLAVGEGAVWVGNGGKTAETHGSAYTTSVSRLDPDSTAVTGTRVLPGGQAPEAGGSSTSRILGVSQLTAGAGGVWAINPDLSVSRIDPDTLELVTRIPVKNSRAIAAGREGVWVIGREGPLVQIDPRTNKVGQTIDLGWNGLAGLALGAGSVWATDLETGLLWRVEPGEDPGARTIDIGLGATAVAFGAGAVWVTNFVSDEVVRVDPDTNEVTARIPLAGTPPSVAAGPETAWVSIAGAPRGEALPASVCGAVLGPAKTPDVLIASGLPLQGPSGGDVRVVADAVRFVLREHGFRAGRHTVGYQSCDDSTAQTGLYDFIRCASNAKAYVATARLVGVIGPFDSPCASAQIPITNRAEEPLAMISPSNTNAGLTHAHAGGGDDEPEVYYPSGVRNYVRVIGPVDFEAAAGAVLAQELGLRRVYVLRSPAGFDFLKSPFRRAAGKLGIAIAGSSTWADEAKTYDALAERIARARPDGIFIAGFLDPNVGALLKALRARLGPKIVLFTGEHLRPSDVLSEAPRAAIGIYVSSSVRAPESLGPAGQAFLREFAKTQPGGVVPSAVYYVAEAAQATEVLLQAIARSDGTRASVTRELRGVKVEDGILGSFQFDRNGDINPASFTIFRITGAKNRDPDDYFAGAEVDRVVRVPATLVAP